MASETDVVRELRALLPEDAFHGRSEISERYLRDWHVSASSGEQPSALTLPRSTAEVAEIWNRHGLSVVPQGWVDGFGRWRRSDAGRGAAVARTDAPN
jgi:hypothetical protein